MCQRLIVPTLVLSGCSSPASARNPAEVLTKNIVFKILVDTKKLINCIQRYRDYSTAKILFGCQNESFSKIEGFKRCQNDRTNSAVIWYFHHHCVLFKLAEQSKAPDSIMAKIQLLKTILFCNTTFLCNFWSTPKWITMSGQCRSTFWLLFSTLKQKMTKMYCKNHYLFWQWSSFGILGCNLTTYTMPLIATDFHLARNLFRILQRF